MRQGHIALNGVKAAYDKLINADAMIITDYAEYSQSFAMFRIADPDGNCLEIAGEP